MHLPAAFSHNLQAQLGDEWAAFQAALKEPAPTSIRLNPLKPGALDLALEMPVPWCEQGRYLSARPVFTLDPLLHAGAYYVQEASSMFLCEAVRQWMGTDRPIRALDLCAAPGGKSTLLASLLPEGSFLLANEVIRSRAGILRQNLERWGAGHTGLSVHDSREFGRLQGFFDLVLVDAPCSGEGLFRKEPQAIEEWSEANVQLCAGRQKRILAEAVPLLRPGGLLLYSTCTYNAQENEDNAAWLEKEQGLSPLRLDLPADWKIVATGRGYQLYPHRVRGEGLFLAGFRQPAGREHSVREGRKSPIERLTRKESSQLAPWLRAGHGLVFWKNKVGEVSALPEKLFELTEALRTGLSRVQTGQLLGTLKGDLFLPSHTLALSEWIDPEFQGVELPREKALRFLKKEAIELPVTGLKGWALARYRGRNLGWFKALPNRINNYFPKEWRIRMELE